MGIIDTKFEVNKRRWTTSLFSTSRTTILKKWPHPLQKLRSNENSNFLVAFDLSQCGMQIEGFVEVFEILPPYSLSRKILFTSVWRFFNSHSTRFVFFFKFTNLLIFFSHKIQEFFSMTKYFDFIIFLFNWNKIPEFFYWIEIKILKTVFFFF